MSGGSYDDDDRAQLERAEGIVFSTSLLLNHAAATLKRIHERHPLYYRANQILRSLDEFGVELQRERGK